MTLSRTTSCPHYTSGFRFTELSRSIGVTDALCGLCQDLTEPSSSPVRRGAIALVSRDEAIHCLDQAVEPERRDSLLAPLEHPSC